MSDLYLIRRLDEAVFVYTACGEDKWKLSRIGQASKVKHVLVRGPKSWMVQDQSHGRSACVISPAASEEASQLGASPPLGAWRSADGKTEYTLTDSRPSCPPMEPTMLIDEPFAAITYTEEGNTSRLHVRFKNASITNDSLEHALSAAKELMINLARRPDKTLLVMCDLREAPVPGMRHVRRFMAFANETGDLMDLLIRGNAIIIKPTGIVGNALVSIVKMLQRVLQPAWPDTIVPTVEEGDKFLASHTSPSASGPVEEEPPTTKSDVSTTPGSFKADSSDPPSDQSPFVAVPSAPAPPPVADEVKDEVKDEVQNSGSQRRVSGTGAVAAGESAQKSKEPAATRRPMRYVSRSRNKAVAHPELERLEVPVWVEMGFRPGRVRTGSVDTKRNETETDMEGEREPVLCGCHTKRSGSQSRWHALFSF